MKNEKTAAFDCDGLVNFNERLDSTPSGEKKQQLFTFGSQPPRITITAFGGQKAGEPCSFIGMRLACDECCLPLHLYGENFVEAHSNGRSYLLKCLCDEHAGEFRGVQK